MMMDKPMPISEAVKAALDKPRPLYLSMQILTDDEASLPNWMSPSGCFTAGFCYDPDERAWKGDWQDGINVAFRAASAKAKHEQGSRPDAASALRAIADQLSPAPQAKALEIAAEQLISYGCPDQSTDPEGCFSDYEHCQRCWHDWLLQQAREFFAGQAAAEEEPPCST